MQYYARRSELVLQRLGKAAGVERVSWTGEGCIKCGARQGEKSKSVCLLGSLGMGSFCEVCADAHVVQTVCSVWLGIGKAALYSSPGASQGTSQSVSSAC